mmetsp:Transcript_44241/g.51132  ORF Transcript_44241/g.51132 Transcript_44241/m.51132 type:complete len:224 (-) Transcript_44241:26-697(-)
MMPVFETGGDNRHCPWEFDSDTVNRYRHLVDFHHSLVPYLYANGLRLAEQSGSLVTPVATGGHLLGPAAFAYPILTENATEALITMPTQSNGSVVSGWYLYQTTQFFTANSTVIFNVTELDTLPFFVAAGNTVVTYDTLRGNVLFPSHDTPIAIHVYLDLEHGPIFSFVTYDAEFWGIKRISGLYDASSRTLNVTSFEQNTTRCVTLCVFLSSFPDSTCFSVA